MAGLIPFVVIGVMLSFMAAAWYLTSRYEKQRALQIEAVAGELGFESLPIPSDGRLAELQRFELLRRGRGNKAKNFLHRSSSDVDVLMFDHQYTVSSGKNSHTYRQSVVTIRSEQLSLPGFVISPEHFFHRIVTALGYQDIDFAEYPQFSKKYLLRGSDEAAIREALQSVNLDRLVEFNGICIEVAGNQLLVWYGGKRSKPEDLRKLFEKAFEIFVMFKD